MWIGLRLQLLFINSNEFFALAGVLAKNVVSDSIEPGGKLRFASKTTNVFVRTNERFLGQIVGQLHIGADELAQKPAHGRLMTANQLAESMLVTINKNSCEQIRIGQLHIIVSTLSARDRQVARPVNSRC